MYGWICSECRSGRVGQKMNRISVIIPTWNRMDTIGRAINSALSQTLSPFEVLVCDDGSTDNTKDVVESFRDSRVRWLPGPHCGQPAMPRNRGIKKSRGTWLAFLDSDDEWLPEKLEWQYRLAEASGCNAVCSNAFRFRPRGGIQGEILDWESDRISFDDLLSLNLIVCSSALVKSDLIDAAEGFPEKPQLKALEDYALWLRIATQTHFAYVKESLVIYSDAPENSIRREDERVRIQQQRVLSDFMEWGGRESISQDFMTKARGKIWELRAKRLTTYLIGIVKRAFGR